MIYITLPVICLPLIALMWAIAGLFIHRRDVRSQEYLSLLGAFLTLPLSVVFIGALEYGWRWLLTPTALILELIVGAGIVLFIRAEVLKSRDRRKPVWACTDCGYDRRGVSGPCPECGSPERPGQSAPRANTPAARGVQS